MSNPPDRPPAPEPAPPRPRTDKDPGRGPQPGTAEGNMEIYTRDIEKEKADPGPNSEQR